MVKKVIETELLQKNDRFSLKVDYAVQGEINEIFTSHQVGSVAKPHEVVNVNKDINYVRELFLSDDTVNAVPVEEDDRLIGIIERDAFEKHCFFSEKNDSLKNLSLKDAVIPLEMILCSRDFMDNIIYSLKEISLKTGVNHFIVMHNENIFLGLVSIDEIQSQLIILHKEDLIKAKSIQQFLLPNEHDVEGFPFYVSAYNRMKTAIGGDFYVAQKLNESLYVVAIFDVSGTNTSAALLTVSLGSFFAMIKTFFKCDFSASNVVSMLDTYLENIIPIGHFITGALCFIDTGKNYIHVLNCGHSDVYITVKNSKDQIGFANLSPTLPPFGMGTISESIKASSKAGYQIKLDKNIQIGLFSDGFSDMKNQKGERFSESRVKDFFKDFYSKEPFQLDYYCRKTVEHWTKNTMINDDITVLNIRMKQSEK